MTRAIGLAPPMNTTTQALRGCQHCGAFVPAGIAFCCSGCETVFSLLNARGLGHYYELQDRYSFRKPAPVKSMPAPPLADDLGELTRARFYIDGIHCLGCLWLLEKLPELLPGVVSSSLDIAHQILEVEIRSGAVTWDKVLSLLSQLGYPAKILKDEASSAEARREDQRRQLVRLATTAFSAGNIMLLTVCIYAGSDPAWTSRFQAINVLLAVPALSYGAWPLYRAAFGALRRGRLSVDLPIVFALLAGILLSAGSLLAGNGHDTYFDSLTMLVFLLLSSRYFLARYRESMAQATPYLSFLSSERYARDGQKVRAEELKPGDRFLLAEGQRLPVDAVLAESVAHFDLSLLTGESAPVKFQRGDRVEAGAKGLGGSVELLAERPVATSRLQRILDQIQAQQLRGSQSVDFADRMGRYFVWVVLSLATFTVAVHSASDIGEGLRRALALVIVTCPCVLALAVPLALTRSLQRAATRGLLVRGADKVEALATARKIFLDKTGTVTTGDYQVLRWEGSAAPEIRAAVLALEARSAHPVGKAIARHLAGGTTRVEADYAEEIPGQGVIGLIFGENWSVLRASENLVAGENRVKVLRGHETVAEIILGDSLRPEAPFVVDALKRLGLEPCLLSGDSEETVAAVARKLGLSSWQSRLSPEEKAAVLRQHPGAVMVGDGANDAIAFRAAGVGIALQGAVELSLQNSDLVITKPSLTGLIDAIWESRSTMALVRRNFAFTLAYNVVAGSLAVAGLMSPLLAAVIMPLSALTVFSFTQWQTRRHA